jgi:predicted Rossmann fold flavoprotein
MMFGAYVKKSVVFVDANPHICAKVKISGGGKCNLTNENVSAKNYLGDEAFISKSLERYSNAETLEFFAKHGVVPSVKKDGQYFCKSSSEVLGALYRASSHHTFLLNQKVKNVTFENGEFITELDGERVSSKKLVVASGGVSYQSLNASDIGYKIASSFGHEIKPPTPALVGLTLQKEQFWIKELSGVSVSAKIKYRDFLYEGDLLFSHKGISGPVVLNASLRWEKGGIAIDFLPTFTFKNTIWQDKKQPTTLLPLPKSFTKAFLNSVGLADKPFKSYLSDEREKIISLKNYTMSPAGTFGFSRAEITKGGVKSDDITPVTFESERRRGLYFIGEVLDVSGELGGYNLQWAFSSGANAAKNF